MLRSFVLTSLLTALVFFALLDGPVSSFLLGAARVVGQGNSWSWAVRLFLVLVAILLGGMAYSRARKRENDRRAAIRSQSNVVGRVAANPVFGRDPRFEEIRESIAEIRGNYFSETVGLFGSMLINPTYRARMSERFTLARAHARKSSRAEYAISFSEKEAILARANAPLPTGQEITRSNVLLVPLMPVRKGTLLADLVITDGFGNRLPELSQKQTMGLTAIALRTYLELAFHGVANPSASGSPGSTLTPHGRDAVWRLRQLISYKGIVARQDFEAEFKKAINHLTPRSIGVAERFEEFCLYFAENYYMACEAPIPEGFSVSVELTTDVSMVQSYDTGEGRLRNFFGMEPQELSIDLDLAQFWPNYHAEVDGADRVQYVYRQALVDLDATEEVDEAYLRRNNVDGQIIYSSEPGRISPRINVRNFAHSNHPRLRWNVFFDEVPPGALAPVLALSVITTTLAFAFSFIVPTFGADDFDAPALVIALPLFVVSFWGFSFEKLSRSSLPAVFGFVSTAVIVVICAMLVLTSPSGPKPLPPDRSVVGLFPISTFSWPLMFFALLSLAISITMFLLLLRRLGRYAVLARRDDQRSTGG